MGTRRTTPRRLGRAATAAVAVTALAAAAAVADPPSAQDGFRTSVKPYARGLAGSGWETVPILSAADRVPETGAQEGVLYRMVGIPDGLGAYRVDADGNWQHGPGASIGHGHDDGLVKVLMNHEIAQADVSEPRVGRPKQRGAFVSEYTLNDDGEVLSGRRAFDRVYQDQAFVGPAAEVGNATPAFARFCSGGIAGPDVGFDRPMFFTGEEVQLRRPQITFDPRGSQTVVVYDGEAHALSGFGRFPRENSVVVPDTGDKTIVFTTEDGPTIPDSQLYMYVGDKDHSSDDPLVRNGLVGGKLYVLAADDGTSTENELLQGDSIPGHFEEIAGADQMSDLELEVAADAAHALGFVRIEDAVVGPRKNVLRFVTTGNQAVESANPHVNELGRLYKLRFHRSRPLDQVTLTQSYNADQVSELGQPDGPLSPDNVDVGQGYVAINEDGHAGSEDDMLARDRDGSIWMLPIGSTGDPTTFTRAAELVGRSEGGRDNIRTPVPGTWETSGIIDTRDVLGDGTWLFDVQAPTPSQPPEGRTTTVTDGQLLLLRRTEAGSE